MKAIKAIVKPFKVDDILTKLQEVGCSNITVSWAEGTGTFSDDEQINSTSFLLTNFKVAIIEIVCNDSEVEKIVSIISIKGRTGNSGDGIIYVTDVLKAYRVKTGTNI
ncbi:MAG: P-II family nitrogen regulator [Bacteroidia bacterium]|nr:P-II family nitrogen regulator [Bacteroidia bacterium]